MTNEQRPEATRKRIFRALVDAQDSGMEVSQSRSFISEKFDLSEPEVKQIERKGLDRKWPPLG